MLSLSKIKEETDKLSSLMWDWFEVIDELSPDEAYDTIKIIEEMEKWYNCSLQLMKETGYLGLDEFKQLFKDEKFSMFSYLHNLFFGKGPSEEEKDEFRDRFFKWRLYLMLYQMQ